MLYTRKGDDGTTKAFDSKSGQRVSKSSAQMQALGELDELNSVLGLAKVRSRKVKRPTVDFDFSEVLLWVQNCLFSIQAEVAGAGFKMEKDAVSKMEKIIEAIESNLPPIKTFFIAGGSEEAAIFDVARAITRRAERSLIAFEEEKTATSVQNPPLEKVTLAFMNRLSSLLYAFARYANHSAGINEKSPWYDGSK